MGVTKEIVAEGSGATPAKGANVTVHCTGYGKDSDLSKKFWRCVFRTKRAILLSRPLIRCVLVADFLLQPPARRTLDRSRSRSRSASAR